MYWYWTPGDVKAQISKQRYFEKYWSCDIGHCSYFIVCFLWSICLGAVFLWCSEKSNFKTKQSTRVNQNMIKSSWKEYFTWKSFKFWPIKNISENYQSIRVWIYLVDKTTENNCGSQLFLEFTQIWKRYFTSLDKIHILTSQNIKSKYFLWTKILDILLLTKYSISVHFSCCIILAMQLLVTARLSFRTII